MQVVDSMSPVWLEVQQFEYISELANVWLEVQHREQVPLHLIRTLRNCHARVPSRCFQVSSLAGLQGLLLQFSFVCCTI